jgi:hypothetical protein
MTSFVRNFENKIKEKKRAKTKGLEAFINGELNEVSVNN